MWKCPICKTDNQENRICIKCGFDDSSNYLHHKTIGQLPDTMLQQFIKDIQEQSVVVLGEKDIEKPLKKQEKARKFIKARRIVAVVLIVLGLLTWFVNQRIKENTGGYDGYHYGEFYNDNVEIPENSDQSPDFSGIQ